MWRVRSLKRDKVRIEAGSKMSLEAGIQKWKQKYKTQKKNEMTIPGNKSSKRK